MENNSQFRVLPHHGYSTENYRKTVMLRIKFSVVLILIFSVFSLWQNLESDLILAISLFLVPLFGFGVVGFCKSIDALEVMLFYLKSIALLVLIIVPLFIENQSSDFQIRVAMIYALLYFAYISDFLYINKMRFFGFAAIGCLGAFFLPVELTTRIVLVLALIFITLLAFDTVKLRQQNMQLIDELQQSSEETIYKLSHFDSLTGFPNRTMFAELGEIYTKEPEWKQKRLAVLAIGLDGFKAINESFGHSTGDLVLQQVSTRIKQIAARHQNIVSRFGGDHFTVAIMNYPDKETVERLAQKLLATLAEPIELEDEQVILTCSVGIAFKVEPSDDFILLAREAETAMNEAKIQGRNRYLLFQQNLLSLSQARLRIENSLRRAINEQKGFYLEYQPKINIQTEQICGVEALVRWQDKELGSLSPADFIPIAEHTGLIVPLGYWIFEQALIDLKTLQLKGIDLHSMSINLSARQFEEPSLLDHLLALLHRTGVKAEKIDLELTESAVMRSPQEAIQTLSRFQQERMTVSIDDFGIAYSSLSYLKSLPASRLKIDQSFIRELEDGNDDYAITASIIEMGHNLGLKVLAEGVETQAQCALLKKIGCDEIQGFYYSRPLPLEKLIEFIQQHNDGLNQ
ncbi:EAL domain-containing protein [Thiomicrorhabdus sediminis]|uniref:EAL domain-containing protein n=1 Tax=Thiomicrorhabdus sediminis TaxID=2580412 RepID=UPI00143D350A|nr:EAL domain-containing protein [Thiomicrorhabdus sediminis]